ncbi:MULTISPECIES: YadA-like family protein [unclassified Bartonella]|uniref:YadA-like family protein n=1 Tax=unclassified Bartonella TaxID=2645622 RepID=UPI00099B1553|nr:MULTISPECIES: YadA-like family protein [unclassified Bartonella]AQX22522.1 YadA-like C-terminal region [Bartonella sp. 11B]AQX24196.1 YadA-like C-terminal region [Bartonella sp. 114]
MKKSYLILKSGDLRGYSFSRRSPLLKAASLGTAMAALLSSVAPVVASNFSPTEQQTTIQSSQSLKGTGVISLKAPEKASKKSRDSVFASDRYCGIDNIVVSNSSDSVVSNSSDSKKIISEESYVNLLTHHKFDNWCSHGFGVQQATWTVDGKNTVLDVYETRVLSNRSAEIWIPGTDAVWFGSGAEAEGDFSIAIGQKAYSSAVRSIALGAEARVVIERSVALGAGSEVGISIKQPGYDPWTDKLSVKSNHIWKYNDGIVSIAAPVARIPTSRLLTGVAAGIQDTDAVNVAQLQALRQWTAMIAKNASTYLGGKADILSNEAPTYIVQTSGYRDVGSAFKGVDGSISDLYSKIANVAGDTLVQQEGGENALIAIGLKTGGTEINFMNRARQGRRLSGLADGKLSDSSTEAVTGKQLYDVDTKLTKTTQDVTKVQGEVATIAKNTSAYLGGGADILGGKAPTYKIQGSNHRDVGSAFVGVDGSISDLYSKIANVAGDTLVQQEGGENALIAIGLKTGGTEINFMNRARQGRRLSGLADGKLSDSSTEAVTGKQLYDVDTRLTKTTQDVTMIAKNASASLGGGANILSGVAPTYKIQGSNHRDVGSAFKGVDGSISDLYSKIANGAGDSLVQQEKGNGRITIGSKVGGTAIDLTNKEGKGRTLSGLADGKLSDSSTEAVTGKQLYDVDTKLTKTTQDVTKVQGDITKIQGDVTKVQGDVTKVQGDVSTIAKNASAYLGGGADILGGKAPTYKIQGSNHRDVGSAFVGVDGSISDLYSKIANVAGDSLVQQEQEESSKGRITIGSKVGGTAIDLTNKEGKGRRLSGLADGKLSDSSTEAVTGKQLYEVDTKLTEKVSDVSKNVADLSTSMDKVQGDVTKVQGEVSTIAKNASAYLGGGADILSGEAPTYKIQGSNHHDVGSAFVGVDGSITDLYSKIAGVAGGSLVEQEQEESSKGRITIGSKVGGTEINLLNNQSVARVLSGLGDGAISEGSNQAVTGNQLYLTNKKVSEYLGGGAGYEDGEWVDPTFTINVLQEDGSTEEKEYKNVADALKDISSSFTTVVETNLIQQEESEDESGRILIGSKVGGTEVNLTNKDGEGRTLSGLKDGKLSDSSTEAVTGKQLYEVDTKLTEKVSDVSKNVADLSTSMDKVQGDVTKVQGEVSTIAKNASAHLGGGADILSGEAPTYKIQGSNHHDVGSAFVGVDGSITDLYSKIAGVAGGSLVEQEQEESSKGRITIGSKVGGTEINLLNNQSVARVLSGLGDGAISEGSNQAVTGNQLYLTNKKVSEYLGGGAGYEDGEWVDPTFTINVLQEDGSTEEKEYKNVADALKDISSSFTTVVETNLIQQEESEDESGRILIGSKVGGTEVNLTNKDGEGRTLSGLKDGKLSDSSTEAVTGKQLYEVDTKLTEKVSDVSKNVADLSTSMDKVQGDVTKVQGEVSTIAKNASAHLGGGADILSGEAPTYKIQGSNHHDVGSAFVGVDGSITDLYSKIAGVAGGSLVEQEQEESSKGRITIGSKVGGTEINLLNNQSVARVLSGLGDGAISEGSNQAVTGNQLYLTNKKVSEYLGGGAGYEDGEWVDPTFTINVLQEDGSTEEKEYKNVADALKDISSSFTTVVETNLIQQEESEDESGRILIGSKVGGTEVNLTNKDGEGRTLSGLKDGKLSDSSTEAVTGKQLYEVDTKLTEKVSDVSKNVADLSTSMDKVQGDVTKVQGEVSTIAKNASAHLGGGADILSGEAPTYKIQGSNHHDVGSAFVGVDGSITDLYSKIAGVAGGSLVEQEQEESSKGRITIGSKVGGTEINLLNNQSVARVLSGLGDGAISEGSNQAVTGNQLYLTNKKVSEYLGGGAGYEDGEWVDPTFTINVLQEDGSTEEKEYKNVADALKDISSSFTTVVETNLIQQEESEDESGRILIGSKVGGTEVNLTNKDGEGRTLSGLKDGKLSDSSTEAVTGKQLYEVDTKLTEKVSDVSKNVADLSTSMDKVQGDVTKVQGEVSTIAKNASAHLGGGADILSGEAPTYKIQGSNHHDVGSAFVGVDSSITDLYSKIVGVAGGSLVEQEQEESSKGRITIGSKVGGTEVNFTNKDGEGRTLSGLKDGKLSDSSTEAVTGKQLYEVDTKLTETTQNVTKVQGEVSTIAKNASAYLGGGADILSGEAPTYKVQGNDYNNVGSAFAGVDSSLSDIYKELSGVGSKSLVQQEEGESGRITIGSKTGGTEINLLNNQSVARVLSGLGDGAISEGSNHAVTGNQLYLTNKKVSEYLGGGAGYEDGEWVDPTFTINVLQEDGSTEEKEYKNVADALKDISSSFTTVVETNLIQQEESEDESGRILIGSKVGGTEVNLTNKDGEGRTLSGLKDGKLSDSSTEAVTGKQLYEVDTKLTEKVSDVSKNVADLSTSMDKVQGDVTKVQGEVSTIAKNASAYLGGGADILSGEAPTYKIQGSNHHDVGSAFVGVDSSITDLYSKIVGVAGGSLVEQEQEESSKGRITIGSKVGGTEVNFTNKDGEGRTLSGLKDGKLSDSSTEAVTGKQLYEVDTKLTETTQNVTKVQGEVSTIARNASAYLGGGADILGGEAPTYKVQGNDYNNVGLAFAGVDDSLSDIYKELSGVGSKSLVQQEEGESGRITIGAKTGGTKVDLTNKDGKGRTLSGLTDGKLSDSSTEAVTGKQLYEVDTKLTEKVSDVSKDVADLSTSMDKVQGDVTTIAKNASSYLGGGSDILGGIAPSYKVQGSDYSNVGEAFAGVDGSLSDIYKELSGVGSKSLVQQEEGESGRITIGAKTGGTEINLLNNQSVARVLSGLGDGAISEGSNHAVTGNQLYLTNKKVSEYLGGGAGYEDGEWVDPTFTINVLQEDGSTEEKEYKNVADALKDISSSFTTVVETNLIQQEESEDESGRILIGSKVGGTEVNLTNKDGEGRTLSGLKDGKLSDSSTEAVTGKQLYEVDTKLTEKVSDVSKNVADLSTSMDKVQGDVTKVQGEVSTIAKNASAYLGGGADILSGEAPTYKIQGSNHHDVGSAFVGVDSSITDLYSKIVGVAGGSLVEQEQEESSKGRITIGSKVGGTEVNFTNKDGEGRTLSGLKDGKLSDSSTEAVTGKQLYEVDTKLTETTQNVTKVQGEVSTIARNASAYLGGGADILGGEAPTYKVQGNDYNNVGLAFAGVDDSLSDIYKELSGVGSKSLVQQEEGESGRITIGAKTGGTKVDLTNKDGKGRTLSGLTDGKLSDSSTEAVTGKQLYEVDTKLTEKVSDVSKNVADLSTSMDKVQGDVTTIAKNASSYLGGGSDILGGIAPSYKVQGSDYSNVGEAFAGVDGSLSDIYKELSGVGSKSLVQQEEGESGRITIGAKTGGTKVDLTNKDGKGRTLSGLTDGKLSDSSTEAVTGKQLYEVDTKLTEKVSDVSKNVADLSTSMDKVQGDVTTIAKNASSYLGGGSDILGGIAPSYKVQGSDYSNVGEAFTGVDDSLSDIYKELSGVGSKSLVQQEEGESGRITIGAKTGGTKVDLTNKDGKGRTLSGLTDGTLSDSSTEAVTGKQLYEVDTKLTEKVSDVSKNVADLSTSMDKVQGDVTTIAQNASSYLGGGSDILGGIAPSYKVQGSDYSNVGEAFAGVDDSLSDIYKELSGVGSKSLVQQEEGESGRITIGAKTGGTKVDLTNKDGKGRTLSGLTDGKLSDSSTEAVTGKQLYEVDTKLTETTQNVTKVQGEVSTIARNASAYLGGGADILGGEAPTYKVQGNDYNNVGLAFAGVDDSLSDIYKELSGVGSKSLVQQEEGESGRITIGAKTGGTKVDLTNKDGKGRTLSGLTDGKLSDSSTEAVTGKQLYEVDTKLTEKVSDVSKNVADLSTSMDKVQGDVTTIAKNASSYLGGGSDILGGIAPSYKVQGSDYSNVGEAFAGVDGSLSDIYKELSGVGSKSLVQQEEGESGRITIGAKTGGTKVDLTNKDGKGRTLSGLTDGKLSDSSTEAVTGKQLYEVDTKLTEKVSDVSKNVADLSTSMDKVQGDVTTIAKNASSYLGGGSDILGGIAPSYKVQGSDYSNVGEAFTGVDDSLSDIYKELSGVGSKSLVQQEEGESGRITIGAKTGGTKVDLTNKDGKGRTLSGLTDGTLSDSSTEAVTGKQLYEVDTKLTEKVSDVSKNVADLSTSMDKVQGDVTTIAQNASSYLGGGSDILGGIAPSYKVQGSDYSNVGEAFAGVDDSLSDIYKELSGVGSKSLVQQEEGESGRITIGSKTGGTKVDLTNKDGKGRTLSGLTDGKLSDSSTEAVTGKQLYEVDTKLTEKVSDVSKNVADLSTSMDKVQGDVTTIAKNASSYLGGGSDILGGIAPSYKVQGSDYSNVGEAFTGVDDSLSDIYKELSGVGSKSLVQQEEGESGRITIGAKTGGTKVDLTNKDGKGRTLSGLTDGTLSDSSTEAVTGKQLYEVDTKLTEKVSDVSKNVADLSTSMDKVQGDVTTIAQNASSYLGGGSDILGGIAPSYKVQGSDYSNVGEAFAGVDDSLSDIYKELSGVGSKSLVQQEEGESGRITIGSKTGGTKVDLTNKDGKGRTLSGLTDGKLSDSSTEAVTGKQLYEVDTKLTEKVSDVSKNVADLSTSMDKVQGDVTTIAKNASSYLGGGSDILGGIAPSYKVQGSDYSNVGEAFAGVDGSLSDIYKELSGVGSKSLVQQEEGESGRITIGAKTGGTKVDLTNKDGKGRTLSGLTDGTLSDSSTEAVTGKQLYEVDTKLTEKVSDVSKNVADLSTSMDKVQGDVTTIAKNASSYLGGGSDILGGIAPSYKVQGSDYSNVGEAFTGVDDSLSDIYKELSGVGSKSLVQQEEGESGRITIGAKTGGTKVDLTNKDGKGRTLSGLTDGTLSDSSTEAVTGKQLYEVDTKLTEKVSDVSKNVADLSTSMDKVQGDVTTIAKNASSYLGGGSDILGGIAPSYKVQGSDYSNVGEAFAGVDDSLSDIYKELSGVGSKSLVQQEEGESGRITIGSKTGGTKVDLTNKDGKGRTLSGLKDGKLSGRSTEAVTGKQLYKVDTKLTETTQKVSDVSKNVADLSTSMDKVQGDVTTIAQNASSYLGGGSDILGGIAPSYKVQGSDYSNVGEAFAGVDDSLSDIYKELSGVGSKSLVQQEEGESGRITIGAKTGGTKVDLTNKDGKGRTLSGLKDGKLSGRSTEAVTGKQLYKVDTKLTETTQKVSDVSKNVADLSTSMDKVQGDVTTIAQNASSYLGGGSDILGGIAPSYKVQGSDYSNVGEAFAGVDTTLTEIRQEMTESTENVAQNSLLWSDSEQAFVARHGKKGQEKNSKLKFLLDGDIAEDSTEAITGAQLYKTNKRFDEANMQLAEYLGGGAGYKDGVWTAPTFNIVQFNFGGKANGPEYKEYNSVAGAFDGVNQSLKDLNNRLGDVENQTEQAKNDTIKWDENKGAYNAKHNGKEATITGVKDGDVSEGSTEAVTGNQLWNTNQKVDKLENEFNDFKNETGQKAEGAVQYDKDKDGKKTNKITLAGGDASAPVVIDNVGDGKVEKGSKEAINGGQLYEKMALVLDDSKKYTDEKVQEAKDYTDKKFESLNYNIEGVKKEARQAAAIGLAAANLRYNEMPGKLSIAVSSGLWRNQSAFAFGAGYTSENGNIRSNISITNSGTNWGVGGGIQFTLN